VTWRNVSCAYVHYPPSDRAVRAATLRHPASPCIKLTILTRSLFILLTSRLAQQIRDSEMHAIRAFTLLILLGLPVASAEQWAPTVRTVAIGDGVTLHYVEAGKGIPVIFLHGSISDYTYWEGPFKALAKHYHVLAYSRRYNYPNTNSSRPGYSATTDSDDLAAFIEQLHLGKVYIVGHSYGALTTLFLLVKHPDVVRGAVLAEPPAVSLLNHLDGNRAAQGTAMFADIERRLVQPMRAAFGLGDAELGVSTFINYVKDDPTAWSRMNASSQAETMRDAHEWEVMMTVGELFPDIEPQAVSKIQIPVLLLSGDRSYPFLNLIDEELVQLIPHSERIVLHGATHQMFYDKPAICEDEVLAFLRRNDSG
jgi:pimeloyl-ACP methyl ester carboxylesterase